MVHVKTTKQTECQTFQLLTPFFESDRVDMILEQSFQVFFSLEKKRTEAVLCKINNAFLDIECILQMVNA